MPEQQREKEVPQVIKLKVDVVSIVAKHISAVMLDRRCMQGMEAELDKYLKTLTPEEKQSKREEIRKQLTDGRLALESLLQRFLSS